MSPRGKPQPKYPRWGNVGRNYLVDRLPRGHIGRFNQWLNGG